MIKKAMPISNGAGNHFITHKMTTLYCPKYNQAVASLEAECLSVALKRAIPIVTIGMAKVVGKLWLTDSLQCVVYDYMLNSFH